MMLIWTTMKEGENNILGQDLDLPGLSLAVEISSLPENTLTK
jgi:hypothetical protein